MPELPEVETVVRDLRREQLVGRRILEATVHWPRTIATPAATALPSRLRGQSVSAVTRRAKYIAIALSGGETLFIHLRMSGGLRFAAHTLPRNKHEHVILHLDDGRDLRYHDPRKFGRWHLVADPATITGELGPEPLEAAFTSAILGRQLAGHARMLKPLLLDQHIVAGLGNIYVDEALWAASLHPCRRSDSLKPAELHALHAAIRAVLRRGIRSKGTTLGRGASNFYSVAGRRGRNQDGLSVFRRTGEPCPRCHHTVTRLIVGQRSTHICPNCQPTPRRHRG